MSIEGLAALLLLAAALAAVAVWRSRRASRALKALEEDLRRAEAAGQEQAARIAALETLRDSSQLAEHAIATGTAVVKEVHKGIADIPFSVLEAIPATAKSAKLLRGLHDSISDGVYGALGNLNKAVGRELRKGFEAESLASTARLGLERPVRDDRAGGSSEAQSLATDGEADALPTPPDQPAALQQDGEAPPSSSPKSWG